MGQYLTQKPRVFIVSSTEGLPIAEAIFTHLEIDTEPSIWKQELFRPTKANIENLENIITQTDFGIVVVSADDSRLMRGTQSRVPRDNVVFELGLRPGWPRKGKRLYCGRRRLLYRHAERYSGHIAPNIHEKIRQQHLCGRIHRIQAHTCRDFRSQRKATLVHTYGSILEQC